MKLLPMALPMQWLPNYRPSNYGTNWVIIVPKTAIPSGFCIFEHFCVALVAHINKWLWQSKQFYTAPFVAGVEMK